MHDLQVIILMGSEWATLKHTMYIAKCHKLLPIMVLICTSALSNCWTLTCTWKKVHAEQMYKLVKALPRKRMVVGSSPP